MPFLSKLPRNSFQSFSSSCCSKKHILLVYEIVIILSQTLKMFFSGKILQSVSDRTEKLIKQANWTKWIIYIGLFFGSIIYSMYMDAFTTYAARETSLKVKQVPIINHPTVIICTYEDNGMYGRHIEDDYGIVQTSFKVYVDFYSRLLSLNHKISKIATRYNGICVKVSMTDSTHIEDSDTFSKIELKFNQSYDVNELPNVNVYMTSENNSPGLLFFTWRDGKVMRKKLKKKWMKNNVWFPLYPEQIDHFQFNANCEEKSYFERFGSKLNEMINFQKCAQQCLPDSLKLAITPYGSEYPICKTKEEEKCIFDATGIVLYNQK